MECRKESYFLEFMYADAARDFVGALVHVLLDGAKGSNNHWDCGQGLKTNLRQT